MATKNRGFRSLTGGALGDLDYFPVSGISNNDASFGIVDGLQHAYFYDTTFAIVSNNSPYQIIPADNATGTGAWILSGFQGATSHIRANRSTTQSIPNITDEIFICTNEIYDTLDEYDETTGIFTPKHSGWYDIKAGASSETVSWGVNTQFSVNAFIDSTEIIHNPSFSPAAQSFINSALLSTSLYALNTEEVTVRIYHSQGGAINTIGSLPVFNWLTIARRIN